MIVLNKKGPFTCDKCGSQLANRKSFNVHILKHGKETMFCDSCPKFFKQKHYLRIHVETEHLKLRSFKCNVCTYSAASNKNLSRHVKSHGEKTECNKCYKPVTDIKSHLKSHVKVKCSICSLDMLKSSLKRHIKFKHSCK